jgi:hypothetical protein
MLVGVGQVLMLKGLTSEMRVKIFIEEREIFVIVKTKSSQNLKSQISGTYRKLYPKVL